MGKAIKYQSEIDYKVQNYHKFKKGVSYRVHAEYGLNTFDCIKLTLDEMSTC